MAEPTQTGGASQTDDATVDNQEDTRTVRKGPGRDPALVARDELLARMDAQIMADRAADDQKFFASANVDARAAAVAAAMAKEARGEALDVDRGHRDLLNEEQDAEPSQVEDGAAAVQPMDAAERKAREAVRISHKGEDPLGDYVVRTKDGKPMFKTLVDGKEELIPLDRARAQLQKHLAADIRLQQAAERQRQLDAREQSIRSVEATLKTRSANPSAQQAPVDDKALDTRAIELVRSLVSEPEDKAAAKMAETFRAIRQAATPQFDQNALIRQAADVAVKTIAERDNAKALSTGLEEFSRNYRDITSDPDLFALADRKTTAIAAEHPDWAPGQVMLEAGRQTREWLKSIGASVKETAPNPSTNNRQQRKQNLVPMPQPRSARPAAPAPETDAAPLDALAEIRKSRGQPY
jgi:hypothetical protein